MMSFVKFMLLFSMIMRQGLLSAGSGRKRIHTHSALSESYPPHRVRCSPRNEAVFKEAISRRMQVDKAMLEIPQVKEWYKRKYTQKGRCFSSGDQQEMKAAVAELSSIWCSWCTSKNMCPCMRRHCFNVTC